MVDQGVPEAIDYPSIPAHGFVEDAAREFPDKPALIFRDNVIDYRTLNPVDAS